MKVLGLMSAAACLLIVLSAEGGDAAKKKEIAALEGVWKIISLETPQGKEDNVTGATLEFDKEGKNITFTKDNETKKGAFKINPAAKPKEIDITPGEANAKLMEGIYELDKTKLRICIAGNTSVDGRPSELAVKDGKSFVLITLERAK